VLAIANDQKTARATAAKGKAVAKSPDGRVVFLSNAVPGDVVDIRTGRMRKSFYEGKAIKFHHLSDKRVTPVCDHFGVCGGCKWQHLPYPKQLFYKNKQVIDNFERIGKIEVEEKIDIFPAPEQYYYRNKLEFSFSNKEWLTKEQVESGENFGERNACGFHVPKMFDKIVNVNHCYLQGNFSNEIRNFVREYAVENKLEFFDIRGHSGFLRNMIVRNTAKGEIMLIVIFCKNDENVEKTLDAIYEKFPQITSLNYVINNKLNDSINDLEVINYKGKDHLMEHMGDLKFKISPKSFYQTNSEQAYNLYKKALEFAGVTNEDLVYDLYTGTGTIANFVAKNAKKVIGIEYVEDAIKDAKINSELNNITNTEFFTGDMKDILNDEFVGNHGTPDVIIIDPPRAGMHKDVIDTILRISPKKIVYISCNPATQARDIALMKEDYNTLKIQPVDMFPQTHHVENIALMTKK
jgi:23S rRNA (uracil1939-C5)-methyltransferase